MKDVVKRTRSSIVEFSLAALVLAAICKFIIYYYLNGYLPPPFFDESSDTFMDWYNTTYWAYRSGTYSEWGSIYPPFSFVFLKLFSTPSCYIDSADAGRLCDPAGVWTLVGFTLVNIVLIFLNYRKYDSSTAVARTIALGMGLPALFALERGNVIVPCFTFFILAHGNLLRSTWLRCLCFGVTVNFKPYLVVAVLGRLLRRKWRWAEGCGIATILVYVGSYIAFGRGTPPEIINNALVFAGLPDKMTIDYMEYATTYNAMTDMTKSMLPLMHFIGSKPLELVESIVPILITTGFVGVCICWAGAVWRPMALSSHRIATISILLFFTITRTAGGYAEVFLFFLVFFEKWKGVPQIIALLCAYMLCIPWDFMLTKIVHASTYSYLSGHAISYDFGVTLGSVVRPGLLLIMEYALVVASLTDIYRAKSYGCELPVGLAHQGRPSPGEARADS